MQQNKPPEGKSLPMINSFLNLCRVCPVPTDDKVNTEYKRNFTWHDGYQTTKVDVIKNAPSLPHTTVEPPLPRKKKYPDVGQHRTRDLLFDYEEGESSDSLEVSGSALLHGDADSRARSEERNLDKNRASPRSRSADSTISRKLKATPIPDEDAKTSTTRADVTVSPRKTGEKQTLMIQSYPPSTNPRANPGTPGAPEEGTVPKTTEYRAQFVAWPRPPGESCGSTARKSASMGLIAPQFVKKEAVDGEVTAELWNSRGDENDDESALDAVKRGRIKKTEYKAKFRPFSAYTYVDGSWKKATRLIKDNEPQTEADQHAWYSEVVERLKKADQYRARSHTGMPLYGSEQLPHEVFSHVRDRTVLSPVSVASSSREGLEQTRTPKEGTRRKPQVEKTTVRPKSAEPVIPVSKSEHKSPKRTRPRAPKDLPVHGHGDLSGRKKAYKQSAEKSSPLGVKPRAVPRPHAGAAEDGKVWLKPDAGLQRAGKEEEPTLVNGFASEEMANGEMPDEHSVQPPSRQDAKLNGEQGVPTMKPPLKVPLTTVKSPEEVTGVRSPDPESWTVPLEIGKGLHWMDGKTPDGVQPKGPPILFSKRLKESSLVGKSQKDTVICDPGSETTGESVDL